MQVTCRHQHRWAMPPESREAKRKRWSSIIIANQETSSYHPVSLSRHSSGQSSLTRHECGAGRGVYGLHITWRLDELGREVEITAVLRRGGVCKKILRDILHPQSYSYRKIIINLP